VFHDTSERRKEERLRLEKSARAEGRDIEVSVKLTARQNHRKKLRSFTPPQYFVKLLSWLEH
jgi:hypothetical protein